MKTKITVIAIFFLSIAQNIQSQSLLDQCVEWNYKYVVFYPSPNDPEVNRCYISGDTIIDQKECLIYHRSYATCDYRPLTEYLYKEDDKLFYYEEELERFLMLYDFGVNTGDTLAIEYWPNFSTGGDSLFYIRIDSIDYYQYDTFELKRFFVTYDKHDDQEIFFPNPNFYAPNIIEDIGNLINLFHYPESGACDGSYNWELRCFNSPNNGLIEFTDIACDSISMACDSITSTSTSTVLDDSYFDIYPNPFVDQMFIKSNIELDDPTIVIFDLTGKELIRKKISINKNLDERIDMSNFPNSIYILNIYESGNPDELKYIKKIVKMR